MNTANIIISVENELYDIKEKMNPDKYATALAIIKAEYAEHGHKTKRSVREAVENRIKRRAREKAIEKGLRIYENRRGYLLDEKR